MSHSASTSLLVVSGADVRQLLPMHDCIRVIENAMREVSRGGAQLPLRIGCIVPGTSNVLSVMPGYLENPSSIGAKVIAVYPENARKGFSSHMGVVVRASRLRISPRLMRSIIERRSPAWASVLRCEL